MNGTELIAAERKRQIEVEGWTPEHDDEHECGELALAAALYATPIPLHEVEVKRGGVVWIDPWPWQDSVEGPRGEAFTINAWDKRPKKMPTPDQRLRMLVKAGALIAAEIDRLQRKTK
jgi:hypothetical protein